jgi:methionine--tRNA ligase beta chain
MISIDTFKQTEIRIGTIINAEKIEGLDKILKLTVDLGEETHRQILSGIGLTFTNPEELIGKQCPFVANLETRTIKGLESQGMIMAMGDPENVILLNPNKNVPAGTLVG